jgi:hypothetical protein
VETSPQRFSDVYYIDASTVQTIDTELKNIAIAREIGDTASHTVIWLASQTEEWLLLFNNADDTTLNLSKFFPSCSHGNILITSRNHETTIHAPGFNYNVADLNPEDAKNLLLGIIRPVVTDESNILVEAIVKELGYLALAVVQAGAYILRSGNLGSYLDNFKKHRTKILREHGKQRADDYEWTVYTTWQISFDKLSSKAATFLRICAFMHHDGISEEIFRRAAVRASKNTPSSATGFLRNLRNKVRKDPSGSAKNFLSNFLDVNQDWDTMRVLEVTNQLRSYSLIDFEPVNKRQPNMCSNTGDTCNVGRLGI